jgi:hypothetical protein
MNKTHITCHFLTFLLFFGLVQTNAQDAGLKWKFSSESTKGSLDKSTGLKFYELEQGARVALKSEDGVSGVVVVMPGERFGSEERMQNLIQARDTDRMLTAMAVALVLPMPAEASTFFVSKEKLKNHFVYRWKTADGTVVCSRPLSLKPLSDKHDVIFVGTCSDKDTGFSVLMRENEGITIKGYERYRPRTISEIIRAHFEPKVLDKKEGSMILTGDTFPSKVKVIYTGKSRQVSAARKQHLDMLVTSFSVDPKVIEKYETELLFTEGDDQYWLPVQKALIPFFEKEVKVGGDVIIYAEWVGAKKIEGQWNWIFMVNEFQL